MSFKDLVAADIHDVFLNDSEFADRYTVRYDDVEYENVPIVLRAPKLDPRRTTGTMYVHDYSRGFYLRSATVHLARADIGGHLPETEKTFEVRRSDEPDELFARYYVKNARDEMGMVHLELEVEDE